MEEALSGTLKPSHPGNLVGFPRYRRSHLKSETYRTLVCILSHCYDESQRSHISQIPTVTEDLRNSDNGVDGMGQESLENESECVKFVKVLKLLTPRITYLRKKHMSMRTLKGLECRAGSLVTLRWL